MMYTGHYVRNILIVDTGRYECDKSGPVNGAAIFIGLGGHGAETVFYG